MSATPRWGTPSKISAVSMHRLSREALEAGYAISGIVNSYGTTYSMTSGIFPIAAGNSGSRW